MNILSFLFGKKQESNPKLQIKVSEEELARLYNAALFGQDIRFIKWVAGQVMALEGDTERHRALTTRVYHLEGAKK